MDWESFPCHEYITHKSNDMDLHYGSSFFFLFYSSRRIFWFSRQVMIIGGTYGFEVGSLADRSGKFRLEIKYVSRPQRKTWSRRNVGSV